MGEVVHIRDFQSKRNLARAEKKLILMEVEIANIPFAKLTVGSGIDGMSFNYTAPEKDPA